MSLHVLPPLERVRGTHVWLPRPDGFVDTPHFPGFGDPETGAVLAVTELPDPYPAMAETLAVDALRAQGIRLLSSEALQAGEHEGRLLHVEQEQRGILFDKWMVMMGNAHRSVMVVASCRAERAPQLSSFLRTLVCGARWDAEAEEEPEAPPFVLETPSGFRPARRVRHGVLLTEDGQVPAPGSDAPYLVVTPVSVPVAPAPSPRELSEQSLKRMPGLEQVELEESGPVLASGRRGYELVARGLERDTGRALVIYQLLLSMPGGVLLVQGRACAAVREALLPRLREAARSVRLG